MAAVSGKPLSSHCLAANRPWLCSRCSARKHSFLVGTPIAKLEPILALCTLYDAVDILRIRVQIIASLLGQGALGAVLRLQ
ncbi:MAG: hypothetical protein CVU38_11140 [Chloroflexi bacterium HGW-Chloroflexi-1]|nr:MAG: hypothetical protein CVU38_11140 [Chloroflexi bacterium HGW-Chloroflexi-1]